jgi:alpha-mannosidase
LRSFRRTYLTAGENLCQIQGEHRFRVALKPLDAATTAAEVIQTLDGFELGMRSFQKDAANGPTPQDRSFAELLAGEFCLTALQGQANGAFVLRGYNPSKKATEVALRVDLPFVRVEATDGCGRSRGTVTIKGNTVRCRVAAKQIVNFCFS